MRSAARERTAAQMLRELSPEFLERYNRSGPRYTSYPTAPEWSPEVTERHFRQVVRRDTVADPSAPLSLYLHIPFCEHRCRFCACNVIITRRREIAEPYLLSLDAEMALLAGELNGNEAQARPVTQLHFGGGTPTYLTPDQLAWLMGRIRGHFAIADGAEISLEADPCVTTEEHMRTLAALGFNRLSMGVQDFHRPVQGLIERIQTVEETQRLMELAAELAMESVNLDLVYGLPLQTETTFLKTVDQVIGLRPDRIALYNFAYLPGRLGHQRSIDPALLPSGAEKFRIFVGAFERFVEAGYEHIGMDHFALPDDDLARARRDRTIQRNFMGYTTQAGTDMCAFGVSAISATDTVYVQNTKKLKPYAREIEAGALPVERGMLLSEDDRLRRGLITDLMCHGSVLKGDIAERFAVEFDHHFEDELEALAPFERDGLVELSEDRLEVTLLGTIFVRNVAMVFDAYLRQPREQPAFSRTL
jgi:oxygen-independent coproporphyrinogen-3 oxidase